MGVMYCKQPNGKICRFSSIVDCITHWDMTDEGFISYKMQQAKEEAERDLKEPMFFDDIGEAISQINLSSGNITPDEVCNQLETMGFKSEEWKATKETLTRLKNKEIKPRVYEARIRSTNNEGPDYNMVCVVVDQPICWNDYLVIESGFSSKDRVIILANYEEE